MILPRDHCADERGMAAVRARIDDDDRFARPRQAGKIGSAWS